MQATISQTNLRQFTRALTCLAKYADDASIRATSVELSLSACSSAQSAFARTTFHWSFFDSFSLTSSTSATITQESTRSDEEVVVQGAVNLKSVLSVLKSRAVQDAIDKCDLMIIEGTPPSDDDDPSEHIESKFVIRFHCKNGIVKTHRIPVDNSDDDIGPNVPQSAPSSTAKIVVLPVLLRGILENFAGLGKSDPALQWEFEGGEVKVKTVVHGGKPSDADGISSSVAYDTSDFLEYIVPHAPVQMKFPWREFDATVSFAETANNSLTIYFTTPGDPLWIEVEGSEQRSLFVISTSPTIGYSKARAVVRSEGAGILGKRAREAQTAPSSSNARKRPAVERTGSSSLTRVATSDPDRSQPTPPPHWSGQPDSRMSQTMGAGSSRNNNHRYGDSARHPRDLDAPAAITTPEPEPEARPPRNKTRSVTREPSPLSQDLRPRQRKERPLFLSTQEPISSQRQAHKDHTIHDGDTGAGAFYEGPPLSQLMSNAELEQMRSTGLGIEDLNQRELDALMDDEGTEVDFQAQVPAARSRAKRRTIVQDLEDEENDGDDGEGNDVDEPSFLPATQAPPRTFRDGKTYEALFD